jgi:hypothetical protein
MAKKIFMLCSDCFSTISLYNHINREYAIDRIIVEQPFRGASLIKRRLRKLGFWKVTGQVLFGLLIVPILNKGSRKRIREIIEENKLLEEPLPIDKIIAVPTVNDDACLQLMIKEKPDIVIVNGTRILSKKILESTDAVFINMHTGITPKYRGVHGGYWALAKNDPSNCGVTVHLVDKGIDTGAVLYQETISVTQKDNFVTYPYLQFAKGIPLVLRSVEDNIRNDLKSIPPATTESRLWSHPTIWNYIYNRVFKRIK